MKLDVVLLLFERVWTSIKITMFLFEIDLVSPRFFWSLSQIFDDETLTEARLEGEMAQDSSGEIMAP
jgi:hypothetical protein